MAFGKISIKQSIEKINQQHLLLPAIQRNFVWGAARIENYFDSVMRGYPLGNFIWWKLDKRLAKKYPFYKFLTHYHQRDNTQNENAQENIYSNDMWGVLDGQQRLSSLYLGITGSLTYKKKGRGHWNNDYNFEKFQLYVNLFYDSKKADDEKEENPKLYDFKFITESTSKSITDRQLWLKIGDLFYCDTDTEISVLISELEAKVLATGTQKLIKKFADRFQTINQTLFNFRAKFNDEDLLHYFKVEQTELDEVLNIFVRVNNGGLILSKSQLMLATLAGTWADARDKVEELVNSLQKLGLQVDNDFVMRTSLTIADLPVLFKVGTFTTKNVQKVISNWDLIKKSLMQTAGFLKELKLLNNKFDLISKNAIIPIAYYISKNGDIKSESAQKDLRKYFVVSQVKGIFGSQGDGVLSKIRESLRLEEIKGQPYILKRTIFNYDDLLQISFSGDKSFKIDLEYIDELTEIQYGSQAYFILTLLYPNIDYDKNLIDMDHIHPMFRFNKAQLKAIGIDDDKTLEEWKYLGNSIPNLQLLTSKVNNNKRAKPLNEYLDQIEATQKGNKVAFLKDNFLPKTDYSFGNFIKFNEKRKEEIISRLKLIFN